MARVPLEAVKAYARIDGDDEDALISVLIDAAEAYLDNAGITSAAASGALYRLAVQGIVLHWYDNRTAVDQTSADDFAPGIRKVINQLKLSCGIASIMDNGCQEV